MCDLTKVAIFQCPASQQGSCYASGSQFGAGQFALLPPSASIVDQNGRPINITSQQIALNQCPAGAPIVAVPVSPTAAVVTTPVVSPTGSIVGAPSWDNISNLVGGILGRIM